MRVILLLSLLVNLVGCDGKSEKTPEQIQAEVAAAQEQFARERERIERETLAREARLVEQRSLIGVEFVSVNADRLEVLLVNKTDKAIDNQSGSLEVLDAEGNYVTGIGLTDWVPGDVYLPVGARVAATKPLDLERPGTRERIVAGAEGFQYRFTVLRIQFVGEEELSFMDQAAAPEAPASVSAPAEPPQPARVNLVSPEPCAAGQLSIETDEQYYPGPKCEHLQRNIDSEAFKVEFIKLCQRETKAEKPPVSAARVQLSTCFKEPDVGLRFSKRICCDVP